MSKSTTSPDLESAFEEAIEAIPTCALDPEGMTAQRDRYARLSGDVIKLEREPEAILIEFREGYARETLDEALAVERECCPFFLFEFDECARSLRATVRERDMLPALEALAYALDAANQA